MRARRPLLHSPVEIGQREHQLLVLVLCTALLEALLCHGAVQPEQVGPEPLRGLCGHLDAPLEGCDGEVGRGVGGQPQPACTAGQWLVLMGLQLLVCCTSGTAMAAMATAHCHGHEGGGALLQSFNHCCEGGNWLAGCAQSVS